MPPEFRKTGERKRKIKEKRLCAAGELEGEGGTETRTCKDASMELENAFVYFGFW